MKIICLICARKNSKGLADKNIKILNRKPLIQHTIDFAKNIKNFDEIIVSSDSKVIEKITNNSYIQFDKRPKILSGDSVSELDVWKYVLNKMITKKNVNKNDAVVILPCTAPLRRQIDIKNIIKKFLNSKSDGIVAITEAKKNPYFNMVKKKKNNKIIKILNSSKNIVRRQDAPIIYEITTNCYMFNINYILKTKKIFSNNIEGFEVPYNTTLDIDNKFDFTLAKLLINR